MPSLYISGIPKGLDRETTSRHIRRHIETVAQVRTIWIQKDKGCGFVSLYDETSADFVLSLNQKICINGNVLRMTKWKNKRCMPKTTGRPNEPVCNHQLKNDVFVLRGYETYTYYKRHQPQIDVLYQYIQHSPKQIKLKRKSWKDLNHLSQLPSPTSRENLRRKRQSCRKKRARTRQTKQSNAGLYTERKKRNKSNSDREDDCLLKIPSCSADKVTSTEGSLKSTIKTEVISNNLPELIHKRTYATVHVYDHAKRICSIEVDNNNVFESIQTTLKNKPRLPSVDTLLIMCNGRTLNNQWQPKMANNDNIHIVVKGRGGMMQDDPADKEDDGDDKNKTGNNKLSDYGIQCTEDASSPTDISVGNADGATTEEFSQQQVVLDMSVDKNQHATATSQLSMAAISMEEEPGLEYDKLSAALPPQLNVLQSQSSPTGVPASLLPDYHQVPVDREQPKHIPGETERKDSSDTCYKMAISSRAIDQDIKQEIPLDITDTNNTERSGKTNSGPEERQQDSDDRAAFTKDSGGNENNTTGNTEHAVEGILNETVNQNKKKTQSVAHSRIQTGKFMRTIAQVPVGDRPSTDREELDNQKKNQCKPAPPTTVSSEDNQVQEPGESTQIPGQQMKMISQGTSSNSKATADVCRKPDRSYTATQRTTVSPFVSSFFHHFEEYQTKLMEELDMTRYFPDQLTYENVMSISGCEEDEVDTLAHLPKLILRKLIMLDYTSRENDLNICIAKTKRPKNEPSVDFPESKLSVSKEDFLAMFNDDDEDIPEKSGSDLDKRNPIDVFLSIFLCLHPTLKQKVCLKMFTCHLAIPIIFPARKNERDHHLMFSMWPLRLITVHNNEADTSIINCKQNIVCIVRLGRPQVSKSKLANEMLYDTAHNAFFNYDCKLGSSEKQASIGLVEAAWFLPSPKQPGSLNTVTLFLNLRGDALNNAEQLAYLKHVSRVMIIVTDTKTMKTRIEDLEYFKRTDFTVMFLLTGKVPKGFIEKYKQYYMNSSPNGFHAEFITGSESGKNIGLSEIKEAILNIIGPLLNKYNSAKTMQELCDQARTMGITVDEDMSTCEKGRKAAKLIVDKVKDCPLDCIKGLYTPLQKENWQNYTDAMKRFRKSGSDIKKRERLKQEMNLQRTYQWENFKTGKPFMQDFIDVFHTLDDDILVSFLASLKFEFDEKSRREMPYYRMEYAKKWNEFQSKSDADKTQAKEKVRNAEQNLSDASFGVEHIFRELGQIYEAGLCKNERELGTKIANAVARSIKLGFPFELMDGDVANVPLNWVERIFLELKHILGDKKLLTLSILGLQSSGKSTLLNAMFGVTFSVSAGRCTRGIYLQLLPVQENKFKFDYVLVVDTEGLRAPELGDQKCQHDNELATLVLGMADITIVNIKGENTNEVKNILQICVHAFLCLKMANQSLQIRQSCIFIHQNVSDIGAKDSMMHARKKLDETLDRMTLEAAEEENISDIKCFKDVIHFDSNHHVWYFSDLWKGDPPMAPANPGYSRDVRDVKAFIFRTLTQQKLSYLNISDTYVHIKDLWEGILANDFVFSFRNSLEIRSYNALENIYQDLIWELERYTKQLTNSAETELKQCIAEYETGQDKGREVCQYTKKIHEECQVNFQEKQKKLMDELSLYFKKSDKKDEIAKWEESKLLSWKVFVGDYKNLLHKQLTNIESNCRVAYEMTKSLETSKTEIYDQATKLAVQMKGNQPSIPDMEVCFNKMWSEWKRKSNITYEDPIEIKVLLDSILFETFVKHKDVLETEMKKATLCYHQSSQTLENSLDHFDFDKNYISWKSLYKKVKGYFVSESKDAATCIVLTNIILRDIDLRLRDLEKTEWKFDATEVKEILKSILGRIDRHNNDKEEQFTLLEPYKAVLCVHVFRFACPLLENLDSTYRNKYGTEAKLAHHKECVWLHFKDIVNERSATLIACDRFCDVIRENVEVTIRCSLPNLIFERIVDRFSSSKYELMRQIMEDLVKKNKFETFMSYIRDPSTYAFEWLSTYIDSNCFKVPDTDTDITKLYMDVVLGELEKIFNLVKEGVDKKPAGCLRDWLKNVQSESQKMVYIPMKSFCVVESQKISNLDDFIETVKRELKQVNSGLKCKFEKETKESVKWHGNNTPHRLAMEKLWGCKDVCPFCKEPCKWNNKHSMDHSCIQHKAKGVNGVSWTETGILVVENCSFSVQSDVLFSCRKPCGGKCTNRDKPDVMHPYRKYKQYFYNWNIHPSPEISSSRYWEWFFKTFNDKLAKRFHKHKAEIPQSWEDLDPDDAIKSLSEIS